MRTKQIEVGQVYEAKVSGHLVPVRVLGSREVFRFRGGRSIGATVFDVTNLRSLRTLTVSALRLRRALEG